MKKKHTTVIAEAGVNHNGSLILAKKLVNAAKSAGADIVKFQTYITENIIIPSTKKAIYQKKYKPNESQYLMLKNLELSFTDFKILSNECFKKRIEFHARSIFLQGLLLNDIKKLPRFFFPIKKKLEEIHNFFNKMEINMLEACICFAIQQKKVNHFIIGVDKYVQLKNIITIFKKKEIRKIDFSQFSINQEKFIDPRNWKKL